MFLLLEAPSEPDLAERALEVITRNSMAFDAAKFGVAVSGGADSMVLLHVLHSLQAPLGLKLIVLHVNHELRDDESDEDEHFVERAARQLDLPFASRRMRPAGGNLEQSARRCRQTFFKQMMTEHSLDAVAVGHTKTDQAETVLLRLYRGAGPTGLSGMRQFTSNRLLRPLLTSTREEVRDWAQSHRIEWREDRTNLDARFRRNRIRNKLLPVIQRHFNPNIVDTLAGLAERTQAEEQFWTEYIADYFKSAARESSFGLLVDVPMLQSLPKAVQRRLIRKVLEHVRDDLRGLDAAHIDAVVRLCSSLQGHDRVMLPGADVLRSFDCLRIDTVPPSRQAPRGYEEIVPLGSAVSLPFDTGSIRIATQTQYADFCANFKNGRELPELAGALDGNVLREIGEGPFFVSNWEPGDAYIRAGHQSRSKLKVLFQENKVYLWERRHWPVLRYQGEIVWTRKFGVAASVQASQQSTNVIHVLDSYSYDRFGYVSGDESKLTPSTSLS